MIRVGCIADTHGLHKDVVVPECDILICAGDITPGDCSKISEVEDFAEWFANQQAQHHICIAGNHDWAFVERNSEARAALEHKGIHYLQEESTNILGLNIFGSPWSPWFYDWAFNADRGAHIASKWAKIPGDTEILITHGPIYGVLDVTNRMQAVGCEDLAHRIVQLPRIKAHICGHIHEGYGQLIVNGVQCVNASICNDYYDPCNSPIVIEV